MGLELLKFWSISDLSGDTGGIKHPKPHFIMKYVDVEAHAHLPDGLKS